MKTRVFIGMGSSQGDSVHILQGAFYALQCLDSEARCSPIYKNPPWGGVAKNMFFNAVCELQTTLSPLALLEQLQIIEKAFGRTRHAKWDDRTLDLDILFYGKESFHTDVLTIPHAGVWERDSVQVPLASLVSNDVLEELKTIPL